MSCVIGKTKHYTTQVNGNFWDLWETFFLLVNFKHGFCIYHEEKTRRHHGNMQILTLFFLLPYFPKLTHSCSSKKNHHAPSRVGTCTHTRMSRTTFSSLLAYALFLFIVKKQKPQHKTSILEIYHLCVSVHHSFGGPFYFLANLLGWDLWAKTTMSSKESAATI